MTEVSMINDKSSVNKESHDDINYDTDEINRLKDKYSKPTETLLPKIDDKVKCRPIFDTRNSKAKYERLLNRNGLSPMKDKENGVKRKLKRHRVKKKYNKDDSLVSDISDLLSTSLSFFSPEKDANATCLKEIRNITIIMPENGGTINDVNITVKDMALETVIEDNSQSPSISNHSMEIVKLNKCEIIKSSENIPAVIEENSQSIDISSNCAEEKSDDNIKIRVPTVIEDSTDISDNCSAENGKLKKSEKTNNSENISTTKRKSKLSLNGSKVLKNKFKECSQQTKLNGFFKISPMKEKKEILVSTHNETMDVNINIKETIISVDLVEDIEENNIIKEVENLPAFRLSSSLFMSPKVKKHVKSKIKINSELESSDNSKVKHKKKKKKKKKSDMEDCSKDDFEEVEIKKTKLAKIAIGHRKKLDDEDSDHEFEDCNNIIIEPEVIEENIENSMDPDKKKVHFHRKVETFSPNKINMKKDLPIVEKTHFSVLKITSESADNDGFKDKKDNGETLGYHKDIEMTNMLEDDEEDRLEEQIRTNENVNEDNGEVSSNEAEENSKISSVGSVEQNKLKKKNKIKKYNHNSDLESANLLRNIEEDQLKQNLMKEEKSSEINLPVMNDPKCSLLSNEKDVENLKSAATNYSESFSNIDKNNANCNLDETIKCSKEKKSLRNVHPKEADVEEPLKTLKAKNCKFSKNIDADGNVEETIKCSQEKRKSRNIDAKDDGNIKSSIRIHPESSKSVLTEDNSNIEASLKSSKVESVEIEHIEESSNSPKATFSISENINEKASKDNIESSSKSPKRKSSKSKIALKKSKRKDQADKDKSIDRAHNHSIVEETLESLRNIDSNVDNCKIDAIEKSSEASESSGIKDANRIPKTLKTKYSESSKSVDIDSKSNIELPSPKARNSKSLKNMDIEDSKSNAELPSPKPRNSKSLKNMDIEDSKSNAELPSPKARNSKSLKNMDIEDSKSNVELPSPKARNSKSLKNMDIEDSKSNAELASPKGRNSKSLKNMDIEDSKSNVAVSLKSPKGNNSEVVTDDANSNVAQTSKLPKEASIISENLDEIVSNVEAGLKASKRKSETNLKSKRDDQKAAKDDSKIGAKSLKHKHRNADKTLKSSKKGKHLKTSKSKDVTLVEDTVEDILKSPESKQECTEEILNSTKTKSKSKKDCNETKLEKTTVNVKDNVNLSEPEEILLSPNSGRNAFEFMMDRRHKVIGRNSPGKEVEPIEEEEEDLIEIKEKLFSRKTKLEKWNDIKGALKRKLDEAEKEICIELALNKRAKRMRKLLQFEENADSQIQENVDDLKDTNLEGKIIAKELKNKTTDNKEVEKLSMEEGVQRNNNFKNKKRKRLLRLKSKQSVVDENINTNSPSTSKLEEVLIETSEEPLLVDETSAHSPVLKKPKLLPKKPILFDDTVDVDVFKKHKNTGEENVPKVQTGLLSFFGVLKKENKINIVDEEVASSFKVKMFSPKDAKKDRKRKLSLKKVDIDDSSNSCDSVKVKNNVKRNKKKLKEKAIFSAKLKCGLETEEDVTEIVDVCQDSSLGVEYVKKKVRPILEDSSDNSIGVEIEKKNFKNIKNKKLGMKKKTSKIIDSDAEPETTKIAETELESVNPRRSTRVKISKIYQEHSSPDEKLKKKKKARTDETDDESSQDDGKKKKRSEENKPVKKVAAVFLNSVPKPKIDPAILLAKQAFLYSEMPTVLKNKLVTQESLELLEVDIFPTISHVLQKSEDPSPYWNLPVPNLQLLSPTTYVPKIEMLKFGAITDSQESSGRSVRLSPPVDGFNFKTHLEEIKAANPEYPVFKTFRLLREKNGYRFQTPIGKAPTQKPKPKKRGRPKKMVISDDSVEIIEKETPEITSTQSVEINAADYSMWTEKYKPKSSEDIIGNPNCILELKNWLQSWINFNAEMIKARPKRRHSSDSEFESSNGDSRDSIGCRLPGNTVILRGPPGSGKTAAIYAVCTEFGIDVLELNASSKRTGKRLLHELQEATQSHQVRQNSNPLTTFLNKTTNSTESASKMCLLLVEDVDIVFDQDDGFVNALGQLLVTSKRPIALLTTNINCPHLQKFILQYPIYSFSALSGKTLSTWLQILCLLEGVKVEKSAVGELLEFNKGDVRRTILQLQFWVQSGGEALENVVHNSSINFYRKTDGNCNDFHDYAYEDETSESLSYANITTDAVGNERVHTDCISSFLVMRRDRFSLPYPLNIGNVWWNLPHLLNFNQFQHEITKKTKNTELSPDIFDKHEIKSDSIEKLQSIFNVFDSLSFTDTINRSEEFDIDLEPCSKHWEDNLLDSLELEENFKEMRSQRWITKDLTHALIEGHCKLFKTDPDTSCINMAVPVSEERKWRCKRHDCESSYLKVVPLYSALDRAGFSLDYFPILRTISRTEKMRSSNNHKRGNRFYNYLRTLNMEASTSCVKTACNIFKTRN